MNEIILIEHEFSYEAYDSFKKYMKEMYPKAKIYNLIKELG